MRYWLILLLLVSCHQKKPEKALPSPVVSIAKVITKDVPLYIQTVGHIEPYIAVDVKSQVTGVITDIFTKEGGLVKKGDLILTIDDRPYLAALSKAKAAMAESLAQLKYNKDTQDRNTPLVKEEYVSKEAYENLVTNVLMSEASVQQNKAEIESAEVNLSYCSIFSPIDAVAGNHLIERGNLVIEEESSTILTLNQICPIFTTFYIIEKDLPHVQKIHRQNPLSVQASFDLKFNEAYEGNLYFIDNEVDVSTGMIKLKGIFTNEDHALWPGEYVNVRLILGISENALLVPNEAINLSQKGKYIYVVNDSDKVEMRYVKVGQQEEDMTIIESGINMGERVITEGQINVREGIKVRIK